MGHRLSEDVRAAQIARFWFAGKTQPTPEVHVRLAASVWRVLPISLDPRLCSLIPVLGVKLSSDRPCRAHCSLRGRGDLNRRRRYRRRRFARGLRQSDRRDACRIRHAV